MQKCRARIPHSFDPVLTQGAGVWALLLSIVMLLLTTACSSGEESRESHPAETRQRHSGFVENRECIECHATEFRLWTGSDHDLAMQVADPQTVLGDFGDASFSQFGVTSRFFRRGDEFFVKTEGPDGKLSDFRIAYTFGVRPLQQYLVKFPGGRVQCLTIAWDTERRRWFSLYPEQRIEPGDPLHWTGRYQNWNLMCAECHTTDYQKGFDLATDTYDSTWSELNVSCQACHGPGQEHVEWARRRKPGSDVGRETGLKVDFRLGNSRFEVDSCAPCHSRRTRFSERFPHYGSLHDHFRIQDLGEGLYFPDGQIREEVYVYGSFLQSRMYNQGVRCTDCHDPHSLSLKETGNALCTRCHQQQRVESFTGMKLANFDSPTHHFHAPDSEGARCVNCHMPQRTYMQVDPRRDHSFRIPRPDLSIRIGVPNACTQCHKEKSDEWALERIDSWYGGSRSQLFHYGEAMAAESSGEPEAGDLLDRVATDPEMPAIVRATALDSLGHHPSVDLKGLLPSFTDESAMVRGGAIRSLENRADEIKIERASPLLDDSTRLVRMEAAHLLSAVPIDRLGEKRNDFSAALQEFVRAQEWLADMPASHLNLGFLAASRGEFSKAEESYRTAIRMDPDFYPAYMNLANLLNREGRNQEAESVLREVIERAPETGEAYYSLGLLLGEMGRLEEASASLKTAVELMPSRERVRYNYGLTLQHLGRRAEAEEALKSAYALNPQSADIVYALAVFYIQEERLDQALFYARKLVDIVPEDVPVARELVEEILRRKSGAH